MSLSSILLAVRNAIRAGVPLPDRECNCEPDGQPHPLFGGLRYVAVHGAGWENGDPVDYALSERFSVDCTITYRLTMPNDLVMENLFIKTLTGMEALARQITALIHKSYPVMNAANTLLGTGVEGFYHPLQWDRTDAQPQVKGGEWLFSDNPTEISRPAALVLTVHFTNALRIQHYANMT